MYDYGNYDVDLDNIPIMPENRRYWLVRADGGKFFDDFYENAYIGIRYNNITQSKIQSCFDSDIFDKEALKEHIKKSYPDETRPGLVAGYIYTMCFIMKKGDVVVVPSENAEYLIIGEIESDKTLFLEKGSSSSIQDNDIVPSNYCIRKQIKWLKKISKADMDMRFYKALFSHNTISNISDYDFIIDKFLYPYYIKDGKFCFIFQITSTEDVSFSFYSKLYGVLQSEILGLKNSFSDIQTEGPDKLVSKIQVESPGYIVLSSMIAQCNLSANVFAESTSVSLLELLKINEGFIPSSILALIVVSAVCGVKITFKGKDGQKAKFETDGLLEKIIKILDKLTSSKSTQNKELKSEIKRLKKKDGK